MGGDECRELNLQHGFFPFQDHVFEAAVPAVRRAQVAELIHVGRLVGTYSEEQGDPPAALGSCRGVSGWFVLLLLCCHRGFDGDPRRRSEHSETGDGDILWTGR